MSIAFFGAAEIPSFRSAVGCKRKLKSWVLGGGRGGVASQGFITEDFIAHHILLDAENTF